MPTPAAWLANPLAAALPPRTVARREFHAGLSVVVAFLALMAFIPVCMWLSATVFSTHDANALTRNLDSVFWVFFIIVTLVLGVLCGAEEEENETLDFAIRLPLQRWRLFAGKIVGSFVLLLLWLLLAVLLCHLFYSIDRGRGTWLGGTVEELFTLDYRSDHGGYYLYIYGICYSSGLLAGVLIRKVLPAVVVGGVAASLVGVVPQFVAVSSTYANLYAHAMRVLLLTPLLFFAWAAVRFHLREGR